MNCKLTDSSGAAERWINAGKVPTVLCSTLVAENRTVSLGIPLANGVRRYENCKAL